MTARARPILILLLIAFAASASFRPALAQDKGTVDAKPLPPLEHPGDPKIAARQFFARKLLPSAQTPKVIGSYTNGCVAGAEQMPITGDTWQVMRLSRNRYWGYPDMIALLKRLAANAHKDAGWPGILIGDIGQPRGGPALSGHASHQMGIDADIWLTPMPDHLLSRRDREEMSATMIVRNDRIDVDPKAWTPQHWMVIRDAAMEPAVQRIFVNAAIKKALCRDARGDRAWLSKVRPWWGHDYHFHIRLRCPDGDKDCKGQADQGGDDGCKPAELAYWFKDAIIHPKPEPPKPPPQLTEGIKLSAMPAACRAVLNAPDSRQYAGQ